MEKLLKEGRHHGFSYHPTSTGWETHNHVYTKDYTIYTVYNGDICISHYDSRILCPPEIRANHNFMFHLKDTSETSKIKRSFITDS